MSAALMALVPFLRGYGFVFAPTISADTSNYNLRTAALAAGWDGAAPLFATVTINSGVVVSATSTGGYAFDTDLGYPAGSTLALVCAGYICGMGGAGGTYNNGRVGAPGGPALRVDPAGSIPTTIDNGGGTIAGGGGGGGQGADNAFGIFVNGGSGGGGRTGRTNSDGGNAGTFAGAGAGARNQVWDSSNAQYIYSGYGGNGGGWGLPGETKVAGRSGGAAGAAVVGNANITWINTGTRYGSIS